MAKNGSLDDDDDGSPSLSRDEWQEHLELSHYISVFSASAGRVRYVMFIIMVLSVTVLVGQWNTTDPSWIKQRYKALLEVSERAKPMVEGAANQFVYNKTNHRYATREEVSETLKEYRVRLVERVFFAQIPGLGVSFDINDLGWFSGISYMLLLLLLVFSLMREHENLYLALFKVMRLHDRDSKRPNGESTANFLYHALAMGTVFTTPPSLALWRPAAPQRVFLNVVFFVPAFVQGYIVLTNYLTLPVATAYGANPSTIMIPQYLFLGVVIALGVVAYIYAEAANRRWRSAFFHLNPALKRVRQQPWSMWTRRSRLGAYDPFQRKLWAQVVQKLVCDDAEIDDEFPITNTLAVSGDKITYADVIQMCRELETKAAERARDRCAHYAFASADIESSTLDGPIWVVTARWSMRCK